MVSKRQQQQKIDTIESVADTKGVDYDKIDVAETDDGVIVFTIYGEWNGNEEDSVGVQAQSFPNSPMGDMQFRNTVQKKLSDLKKYMATGEMPDERGQQESGKSQEEREAKTSDEEDDAVDPDYEPVDSTGEPERDLLKRRKQLEKRVRTLEERVDDLESQIEEMEDLTKLANALKDD